MGIYKTPWIITWIDVLDPWIYTKLDLYQWNNHWNIFQDYTHIGYSVVDSLRAGNFSEKLVLAPLLRCAMSHDLRENCTHEAIYQEKYEPHQIHVVTNNMFKHRTEIDH